MASGGGGALLPLFHLFFVFPPLRRIPSRSPTRDRGGGLTSEPELLVNVPPPLALIFPCDGFSLLRLSFVDVSGSAGCSPASRLL